MLDDKAQQDLRLGPPVSPDDELDELSDPQLVVPMEIPRLRYNESSQVEPRGMKLPTPTLQATSQSVEIPLARDREGPPVSPRMTAIFGGLFGLATIASIFALLIQVFPVQDQRAEVAAAVEKQRGEEPSASEQAGPKKDSKRRVRIPLPGPWRLDSLAKDSNIRTLSGVMERRSFIVALKEAGVPKAEVYRIIKAFDGIRKFDRTGRRDQFKVALRRDKKNVAAFEYIVSGIEVYQAREQKDGLLRGERLDMKVRSEEFTTAFYIGKDLKKSYLAAGLEPGIISHIDKAFNGHTSSEAFEEGGVIRLKVVETTALGMFDHYDHIEAIEYRPPDPGKPPIRGYYLVTPAARGYVDEKGRMPSAKGWRSPVPGSPITSHFNPKRLHPILKVVRPHNGTDYGAPAGTPIYAAYRGTIQFVGVRGGFGNYVAIDHPQGIETGYAHMLRFVPGLKAGMKVGTRQLIGYVGSTGRSTGPHLHFSARRNGKYFDPMELKMDAMRLLPVDERATFLARKAELDRIIESVPLPEPPVVEPEPEPSVQPSAEPEDKDGDKGDQSDSDEGNKGDRSDSDEGDRDEDDDRGDKSESPDSDDDDQGEGTDLLGPDLSGELE